MYIAGLLCGRNSRQQNFNAEQCRTWNFINFIFIIIDKRLKTIDIDKKTKVEVKCQVKSLSFSAHADAKGIMQLIRQCCPDNVMLVHGEKAKMYVYLVTNNISYSKNQIRIFFLTFPFFREFLQQRIINEFKIPCYSPANGCTLVINPASNTQSIANMIPVEASNYLIEKQFERDDIDNEENEYNGPRGIGDFEDLFKPGSYKKTKKKNWHVSPLLEFFFNVSSHGGDRNY